jgi:hypothetical protein
MNAKQREREEAVRELRELLQPGDTVYTTVLSVSRSGMSRVILPFIIRDNQPQYIYFKVAAATGRRVHPKKDGIVVHGCGMDMGFELVYTLSRALFPDGFKVEGRGRNGDTSGWDKDGGYALNQRWF